VVSARPDALLRPASGQRPAPEVTPRRRGPSDAEAGRSGSRSPRLPFSFSLHRRAAASRGLTTLNARFARSDRPSVTTARAASKNGVPASRLEVEITQGQEKVGATYVEVRRRD